LHAFTVFSRFHALLSRDPLHTLLFLHMFLYFMRLLLCQLKLTPILQRHRSPVMWWIIYGVPLPAAWPLIKNRVDRMIVIKSKFVFRIH
jgi:hypothetical protein